MVDHLWAGKSSHYVISLPGQLNLAIFLWVGVVSASDSWEVNSTLCDALAPYPWSHSVSWYLFEGYRDGDQGSLWLENGFNLLCRMLCLQRVSEIRWMSIGRTRRVAKERRSTSR